VCLSDCLACSVQCAGALSDIHHGSTGMYL